MKAETVYLDPVVVLAFRVIRHLTQLAEAMAYRVLECASPVAGAP